MRDPDTESARTWNGVFPSLRQVWILARWMATPVHSPAYGQRYNAWRVATDREPLTEDDLRYVQSLYPRGPGDLALLLRKLVRSAR